MNDKQQFFWKMKKLMKRSALAFALPLCFTACTTSQAPSLGAGAVNNGNNSASNAQGSGNTAVQSGRNASGYATNQPYSQGTSGNQMSASGVPLSK